MAAEPADWQPDAADNARRVSFVGSAAGLALLFTIADDPRIELIFRARVIVVTLYNPVTGKKDQPAS